MSKFETCYDSTEIGNITCFIDHVDIEEIRNALFDYYESILADDCVNGFNKTVTKENIFDFVKPRSVVINTRSKHRSSGVICDCEWDQEHGISIMFTDPITVEPDISLLV